MKVKEFLSWYWEKGNTGKYQVIYAVVIPAIIIGILFIGLVMLAAILSPGGFSHSVDVKQNQGHSMGVTEKPSSVATSISYGDKQLAKTILEKGVDYHDASSEFAKVISEGDLDTADRGREAMILKISDDKSALNKMNIQNQIMLSSWKSYLDAESAFLYQMGKVLKSTRAEEFANAKASMITANTRLIEANEFFETAKEQALLT